ncbi:MAG: hypothetical protein HUU46_24320 [Candidatus Hydrogenedentes bacterium]|nr:hypothetical protein [Candidatus Hydrogenedentota bacterium]
MGEGKFSKTQIDKLGERIKSETISEDDLRMLDQYRRSFADAHNHVISVIRGGLKLEPTGRLAKSTSSIREKLRRESIRLSQIQDIAGCRIVVPNLSAQDELVARLRNVFPQCSVIDRREKPSHGYRAVHVVVHALERHAEVQVRTVLQHKWAETSEKASDVIDPGIKYGSGPHAWSEPMLKLSQDISIIEEIEDKVEKYAKETMGPNFSILAQTVFEKHTDDIAKSKMFLRNKCDSLIMLLDAKRKQQG